MKQIDGLVTAIEILAGILAVACFGLLAVAGDANAKTTLLIVGVALAFVSASFAGLKENQRARHRNHLGEFLRRGQALTRACQDESADFASVKSDCDIWGDEVDGYVRRFFGEAAVALHNSSDGLPMFAVVRKSDRERNNYESWCRLRCARLSEAIGRLS